jgi:hypothetical protein
MQKKAIGVVPRKTRTVATVCSIYSSLTVVFWLSGPCGVTGAPDYPGIRTEERKLRGINNIK